MFNHKKNVMLMYGKYINSIDRRRLPLAVITNILLSFSEIVFSVLVVRYIINSYTSGNFSLPVFFIIMGVALCFQITVWLFETYYYEYYCRVSDIKIKRKISKELFLHIKNIPLKKIDQKETYDKYYFVINDVDNRLAEFIGVIEAITGTVVTIFSLSTIVLIAQPLLIILFLFPVLVDLIVTPKLNTKRYEFDKAYKEIERRGDYSQRVMYMREYAKDMRLTNISCKVLKEYKVYINDLISMIRNKTSGIIGRVVCINMSYQIIAFYAVIILVCFSVKNGSMKLGDGVVIITLFNQIVYSMKNIANLYSECNRQSKYIKSFYEFKDLCNAESDIKEIDKVNFTGIDKIKFDNVFFSYTEERKLLERISFEVQRGQKVAILGENGAGKSTLVKMLLNLYAPDNGKIFVNDKELNSVENKDYMSLLGLVMQDYRLFSTSIRKNVLEKSDFIENDNMAIENAMKMSGFYDKFVQLRSDFDLILSKEFDENGIVLSGGELQKLAITRAIAKACDVLILDEPTSAMDPLSESKFFDVISRNFDDKIVFFVSHNYSTGKVADLILYMEDGKIIEMGSHSELISMNGAYAKMYKLQLDNFRGNVG